MSGLPTLTVKDTFYPEIRELLHDEEMYVKLQTLESYLEMLKTFESEEIEKDLLEVFMPIVDRAEDDNFIKLADLSGKIIYTLHSYDLDSKCLPKIKELIKVSKQSLTSQKLIDSNDREVKLKTAYNLPSFYYVLNRKENFEPIYNKYLRDTDEEVRATAAGGLHEVSSSGN